MVSLIVNIDINVRKQAKEFIQSSTGVSKENLDTIGSNRPKAIITTLHRPLIIFVS